jgi:hypothetical protein
MTRPALAAAAVAVLLYLPTARYGFVQDDRAIIAANPAAHSLGAAVRAFDDPYWPPPSAGGLYRPLTILSLALDWTVSGGRAGWLHVANALWHGLATLLVVVLLARWLPPVAALAAGLCFAVHPVHVEGVASLVSRTELLTAVAALGAVLAARRRSWVWAAALSGAAMLSKEHGVVVGALILLDDWLDGGISYPKAFYAALGAITLGYLAVWMSVGSAAAGDAAPPFQYANGAERIAIALPAVLRAATLMVWPLDLSADYNPQVIPAGAGFTLAAVGGFVVVVAVPVLVVALRRRAPAVAFTAGAAALTYLPTSNLLFASGVVLAERNLYVAVMLVAASLGQLVGGRPLVPPLPKGEGDRGRGPGVMLLAAVLLCGLLGARSLDRLPAWRDNRTHLLTLLTEHPESYRAHASAAAVLAGVGDTAGARRHYATADSLFPSDPHLIGARAFFLGGVGDTLAAGSLARRARGLDPRQPMALRVEVLLALARGQAALAAALADSAGRWHSEEQSWYRDVLQRVRR